MDKTNDISNSILQTTDINSGSFSNNDSGFFSGLKNISITTWILIILILSFFGFNIFFYLAKGTQDITNFFGPLLKMIFGTTIEVTSDVIDVSAEGAKAVVSGTAGVINKGLTTIQEITPNSSDSQTSLKTETVQSTIPQPDLMQNNTLNKALNTSQMKNTNTQDYEASEASSSVNSVGQAGWCFIGEDKGYRTCSEIGVNDKCMSGDIFPSQEICINPSLRA